MKMKNQFQRMTVAFALVGASGAGASPIFFSNPAPGDPGHVDWETIRFLDITKPASLQVPLPAGAEVRGTFEFSISENFDVFSDILIRSGVLSAGFGGLIFREFQPGVGVGFGMLQPGDIVGPGGVIPQGGGGGAYTDTFVGGVLTGSTLAAPLGESFLAVSFIEIDAQSNILGNHFGWIGFNLFENPGGPHGVEVTRWGYETTIDTAITIPSPGAFPLFAAAALLTTRRRRDHS